MCIRDRYKITKVSKPELPLKFYEDLSAFKLYLCDCGLMGAMADTCLLYTSGILIAIDEILEEKRVRHINRFIKTI